MPERILISMLHFLSTCWIYSLWSLEFLIWPPVCLITIAVVFNVVFSILKQKPLRSHAWKWVIAFPAFVFLCFPATIAVAAAGYVNFEQIPYPGPSHWGLRACDALALISLAAGTYWTFRMKGLRWFAVGVTLLQMWLLAGANFIAGMSLTGRWL
jgi:hypothetical protein